MWPPLRSDPQGRITLPVPEQLELLEATGTDNHKEGAKIVFAPVTVRPGGETRYEIAVRALRAGDVRFRVD